MFQDFAAMLCAPRRIFVALVGVGLGTVFDYMAHMGVWCRGQTLPDAFGNKEIAKQKEDRQEQREREI